jgi:hypothetical protein
VLVGTDGTFSSQLALVEGMNTITIVATDAAGNQSTIIRTVRRDTQSPTINLASPIDSLITNLQSITVSGTVFDSTSVQLTANGQVLSVGSGGAFIYDLAVVEGLNTITVVARDQAGNQTVVTRTITMSTDTKMLVVDTPLDSLHTNQRTITVRGRVKAGVVVTLTVNDEPVMIEEDGTFSIDIWIWYDENIVTVVATDTAGVKMTVSRLVIVDTYPPELTISTPADNSITNQPTINVRGTVVDPFLASLTINGTIVPVGEDGAFSAMAQLSEGSNTITAIATDKFGNVSTLTRTLTLDTVVPNLIVSSPNNFIETNHFFI